MHKLLTMSFLYYVCSCLCPFTGNQKRIFFKISIVKTSARTTTAIMSNILHKEKKYILLKERNTGGRLKNNKSLNCQLCFSQEPGCFQVIDPEYQSFVVAFLLENSSMYFSCHHFHFISANTIESALLCVFVHVQM